jgi:hypothetical protein
MPRGRRWLFAPFLFLAAPCIALAVRAGFAGEYRGASGLVVAMWVFAGVLSRHRVLLAIVAAKLAAEALGLLPSHDGFVTVSIAHYAGAAAGLVGALTTKSPFLAGERAQRARVRRLGRCNTSRSATAPI